MSEEKKDYSGSLVQHPYGTVQNLNRKALGTVGDVFDWFDAGVPTDLDLYGQQVNTALRWLEIAAANGLLNEPQGE